MQTAAVFVAILAAASANTVFRVPSHDSAVINSQRAGGNFAYSVAEAPAYGVSTPIVAQVASPVATTYTVQQPQTTVVQGTPVTYSVNSQVATVPQVATTYAAGSSWPYWYGGASVAAVNTNSPIVYTSNNVEKKIDQVSVQVAHQQPTVSQWTVPAVQSAVVASAPVATTYSVQQPSTIVSSPVATTYSVQQPSTFVSSPVATTYAVQQPNTIVASGTPADTWKTVSVAGNQWIGNQWGLNQYGYAVGHPWGVNTVVV